MKLRLSFLFLLLLTSLSGISQTLLQPEAPACITMMHDRDVNYFEAVKASDDYWKNRKKPIETDEVINEREQNAGEDRVSEQVQYVEESIDLIN